MNEETQQSVGEVTDAPEPEDKASAHNQNATPAELMEPLELSREVRGLPASSLDGALEDFLSSGSRRVGFAVVIRLIASWARDIGGRFNEVSDLLTALKSSNQELHEQAAKHREQIATLKAQISIENKYKPLKNFAFVGGPILLSIGIDQIREDHLGTGSGLIIIGGLLIVLAIWVGREQGNNQ